jgi:putative phosphoesterase
VLGKVRGMKIGILSDTHGNLSATESAAQLFAEAGVGAVLHCGDIGGNEILIELAAILHPFEISVYAVLGNVDGSSRDWKFIPTIMGVQRMERFGEVELDGKRIALLHSDDRLRFQKAVFSGQYDFVFTGHSHALHDHTIGNTRCINPGTAGMGSPNTCVILDLSSGELTILRP